MGDFWRHERIARQPDIESPRVLLPESHCPRYTPEVVDALAKLNAIHASYNYDNSDIMTDYFNVRFYGNAVIDWKIEDGERAAMTAKMSAA